MKYILGIDTTFHASGVGLVAENGKVVSNKKIEIDFTTNENADRFFHFHTRNILLLIAPILKQYLKNIFLISVVNENGPFHSMPVGAIIGNTLSHFFNKEIVGVNHEISHLYSTWLQRDQKKFNFPIISLSISGAHSNLWLIENHAKIHLVKEILFDDKREGFSGLGALFSWICYYGLGIKIKKGEGGYLERLALEGSPKYKKYFNFNIKTEDKIIKFVEIKNYLLKMINEFDYFKFNDKEREQFQRDFARSFSEVLFDLLLKFIEEVLINFQPKEIHLVGGAAVNTILKNKLENFCQQKKLVFKTPLRADFCGDNGAMTALAGYYQWKILSPEKKKNKFLFIKPSNWYYKYYVNKFKDDNFS